MKLVDVIAAGLGMALGFGAVDCAAGMSCAGGLCLPMPTQ